MARKCTEEEKTLLISNRRSQDDDVSEDNESEEEETLSLCDLPVNLSNENGEFRSIDKEEKEIDSGFEFEIGSSFRVGTDSCELAPADELFFKGRILPFRHSVSLDAGLFPGSTNRLITRSESVKFRRTEVRSDRDDNHRQIKNNFIDFSQPSPQPQIRRSSSMTARVNSIRNPKSSSIWDFLRLGLVRTPEIELRTVSSGNAAKLTVSRNSSCSSTSTSSNSKKLSGESRSRNRRRGYFFGDCRCSVSTETMTTVPVKIETEEKLQRKKQTAKKEEKSTTARTRTFEWLKELSQVGFVVDHGRRSLA